MKPSNRQYRTKKKLKTSPIITNMNLKDNRATAAILSVKTKDLSRLTKLSQLTETECLQIIEKVEQLGLRNFLQAHVFGKKLTDLEYELMLKLNTATCCGG